MQNSPSKHQHPFVVGILVLVLTAFSGCAMIPKPDLSVLKPAGPVTKVVAAWEPAVSNGEKPMRGFGGRVYFYDQDQTRPIKVDGTVVVYLFDEDGRTADDNKPDEGIVFDAKTLNSKGVYTKSKLGHSYNLWVPLDAAGPEGPAKKVSLIVRYIPKQGASRVSSQSVVHLPGRRSETFVAQTDRAAPTNRYDSDSAIPLVSSLQPASLHSSLDYSMPPKTNLTAERMISNTDYPQTMQSFTIR